MGIVDLKKELKNLDKNQLIDLISDLYKRNKSAKEFFDFFVNPDEKELFEKHRILVYESFYPKRGYDYSLKNGKQAISEFKKMGGSADLLADLMLYYVETGVKFTLDFGDINEAFYSSLESTYSAALKLMAKEGLLDKFANRTEKVVNDTDDIGWGFHDYLCHVYSMYYPD